MTSLRPGSRSTRSRPPTCPDENELVLLADGVLADRRRASIDRHLDGCATCTLLLAELAGMAAPQRPVPPRYKILRQLGAGAMGIVWEAEDKNLGRRVALKFVRAETRSSSRSPSKSSSRERRTRLFREARALAQLRHPNVVTVYDVGESGDELFLALELVIGMDARTWRIAHPRSPDDIMNVWRQAAAGLAAVHRAGLVHRDIKPDNILVADDGRVLVGDFGLATDHAATTTARNVHERLTAVEQLTATGAIVGTPIYMAYEQLVGEPASQKSDQFALCVSIWEALAGERPFTGPTLPALAAAMQCTPTIPPGRRPADRHVFEVLTRGLAPDPAKRWPSVDALLAALALDAPRTAARSFRPRSRATWLAVATAAIAAAATASVLAWTDRDRDAGHRAAVAALDPVAQPTATERGVNRVDERVIEPTPTPMTPTAPKATNRTARPPRLAATPSQTSTSPSTHVTQSDWQQTIERAAGKLSFGDPAGCLQILAAMPAPPAVMVAQAETVRARCTMKAGDCQGGRAMLEHVHRTDAPELRATIVREADYAYCPLDAGPRERWAPRAHQRLVLATTAKTSCKPVLAFMKKHDVKPADSVGHSMIEATCLVNDGDCAGARATLRREMTARWHDAESIAQRERAADDVMRNAFPQCP